MPAFCRACVFLFLSLSHAFLDGQALGIYNEAKNADAQIAAKSAKEIEM